MFQGKCFGSAEENHNIPSLIEDGGGDSQEDTKKEMMFQKQVIQSAMDVLDEVNRIEDNIE